jgi:hypothetical protein
VSGRPPTALTALSFDVSSRVDTPAEANAVRMRLVGLGAQGSTGAFAIDLDGMRIEVTRS